MTSPDSPHRRIVGRAAQAHLPNRFERVRLEVDPDADLDPEDSGDSDRRVPTVLLPDASRTVIRENRSPDISFRYSLNPYRGCEHGCAYCYARPTHETLGMDAALDFETKIVVKYDAPELLRAELAKRSWQVEPIVMSGVTDCYQPIERRLELTRRCLAVMLEARQPVGIVTKNALVLRDLDILGEMARRNLVCVNVSLTTLDPALARTMEPRTASPQARLRAIAELSAAGVPTRVMTAPIIPGLNDHEIPNLLEAASEARAKGAAYVLLRLPLSVLPVFEAWLEQNRPLQRDRIRALVRETRGGAMNDSRFGSRMRGDGPYAEGIARTFRVFARKHGLDGEMPALDCSQFVRPEPHDGQLRLF
jgi:DNA repair photolyase